MKERKSTGVPRLKVADTRSRRESSTQCSSPPCPLLPAQGPGQRNKNIFLWVSKSVNPQDNGELWTQSSIYLLSHSKTDASRKIDAVFSEFKREFQFPRCARFIKYLKKANAMKKQ